MMKGTQELSLVLAKALSRHERSGLQYSSWEPGFQLCPGKRLPVICRRQTSGKQRQAEGKVIRHHSIFEFHSAFAKTKRLFDEVAELADRLLDGDAAVADI